MLPRLKRIAFRDWLLRRGRGINNPRFQNGRVAQAAKTQRRRFMSQHRSLRGSSGLAAKRNVLKRFERVEALKKRGQWKEGDRITGLRKTKPEG